MERIIIFCIVLFFIFVVGSVGILYRATSYINITQTALAATGTAQAATMQPKEATVLSILTGHATQEALLEELLLAATRQVQRATQEAELTAETQNVTPTLTPSE